ncbi:MAG: stage IV sporulation protein A [Erysipelotrichaceae bacterium]|nr:stage IV sporulation protein A [Erysipelotrichaceae bacterium]MBQ4342255.1 stage IV sporulation protein A [Erysipelotrichaceae bacterium]
MDTNEILKNIGQRCNGDIYLGVVGPVRTGKSTFIKQFMEKAVVVNVKNEQDKMRMIDELPQSAEGKTIMTTEPKFVPNHAATIQFDDGFTVKVRLIDCVGYLIDDARGISDENGMRKVITPWMSESIPFDEAARLGTQKVIQDHSTIGIVVTTDGSITDLPRKNYVAAEKEVIDELTQIQKPFVVLVNSKDPRSTLCASVVKELESYTDAPVIPLACDKLNEADIHAILRSALYEFPISSIDMEMPKWVSVLHDDHWLKASLNETVRQSMIQVEKLKEVDQIVSVLSENEMIEKVNLASVDPATGIATVQMSVKPGLYNEVITEIIGHKITEKSQLIEILQDFSIAKREYDSIASALKMVKSTGYGFASAQLNDIQLSEPELIKQQNRYGVKIKAVAPSIHMIKVDVESTFEPIIGSKLQSEELIDYLNRDPEHPEVIWESDIFGRKLSDLIKDGMNSKLSMIPDSACIRLQNVLSKLVNKGKGNVIAIVL